MKTKTSFISRLAVLAIAGTAFCLANRAPASDPDKQMNNNTTQKTNPSGVPDSTADNPHLAKKPVASASTKLDAKDKEFVSKAAFGGMMEVEMGQAAEKQGKSEAVKNIGRTMVADHTKANKELMSIAKKKGLDIGKPTSMPSFGGDKQYLAQMVSDHQEDVKLFEQEAKNGKDAELKAFAGKTLPVIQHHLAMLKTANGKAK
ncbi:MAG TPA: DUF4142 domain-containing protein [Chthoniobacterales bacterium]|nr:DUF4142 domain-containing protein [Chthoniobacterales bacterium]